MIPLRHRSGRAICARTIRQTRFIEQLEDRLLLSGRSIAEENLLTGTAKSQWDITAAGDLTLQGFATDISVNQGQTVYFKVDDDAQVAYHLDIYRMGYYQGLGARKVASISSSQTSRVNQPNPRTDTSVGLVDCGNWSVTASWATPADATPGIYFAKAIRDDTGGASHIFFIVRDDSSHSDILFKTSDTTWQAYNNYGGRRIEDATNRAYKGSYNRPFYTRRTNDGVGSWNFVFQAEYPLVRFLESNGYDVSYFTSVDADRYGSLIKNHKVMLSVGHDEYWSRQQRTNVEAARDAGVNIAFFSGNEIFRKIRWENSIDGTNTPYRTMVCYKETDADAKIDPAATVWTGTWRDGRFSPPADGGIPENALSGTIFTVCAGPGGWPDLGIPLTVTAADGALRFWRNTSVASLTSGQSAKLGDHIVGYEWDEDLDNGWRPAGLMRLSTTTSNVAYRLLGDNINVGKDVYGPGTSTHSMTLYLAASGALVFSAGTVQWAWGLDGNHDNGSSTPNRAIQQATVNLLADMGVQAATLQSGLTIATASTDYTAPGATITSPASGAQLRVGTTVTITGTATDIGGRVGAVEISIDGGQTWHPATGRGTWSATWTPDFGGNVVILARAVDDSGNLGAATGVSVSVQGGTVVPAGTTIWNSSATPAVVADPETATGEIGVKFRADADGYITGIRFYKSSTNTGTHTGSLWSSTGTRLATGTFTSETASGWQTLAFDTPVLITANTTYIASYHFNVGHYSVNENYFATSGVDNGHLHALRSGVDGGNGVYAYGASAFPTQTWNASNYWIDVYFSPAAADTTPPNVTAQSPSPGATGVAVGTSLAATFNEAIDSGSLSFTLRDSAGNVIAAAVTYDAATRTATLRPSVALSPLTRYTVTLHDVRDLAGNLMADTFWSFTTAAPASQQATQTTAADFQTGTLTDVQITTTGDGELQLRPLPLFTDEFSSSTLSSLWTATLWSAGTGSQRISLANGILSLGRTQLLSTQAVPLASVEARLRFRALRWQQFGLASTLLSTTAGSYSAIFTTRGATSTLYARVNDNGTISDVSLGSLPTGWHTYRIVPTVGGFGFYIDGVPKTTIARTLSNTSDLHVAVGVMDGTSQPPQADWVHQSSYPSSGTFVSSMVDAGKVATWGVVSWTATLPAGTSLLIQTSTGDSTNPNDGTWSAWSNLAADGSITSPANRYLVYRVTFSSSDPTLTPILQDITVRWT